MEYQEIVKRIAPCGLSCEKCCAFAGGEAQRAAAKLLDELGDNFAVYAQRFAAMNKIFEEYQSAEKVLRFLAEGSCTGCRETGCLFQACRVPECARDHKVDFCFQCADFPCDAHGFPERLAKLWLANNRCMKDCGVEEYYNKIKDKPRYP